MTDQLNPIVLREQARATLQAARAGVLRLTALLYAVTLALSLADAAAGRALGGVQVASFSVSFFSIFATLVADVLTAGYACCCLRVARGGDAPCASLFDAFPFAGKVVALAVLRGALFGLGLTLFVVPGVVLALSYSLALFHLCEEPDVGVLEAMRRSRVEMRGHRWALLMLYMSFLPLLLFAALVLLFCQGTLAAQFPDTLAGDVLFVLASGALTFASQLYLRPWLTLAHIGFYEKVKQR